MVPSANFTAVDYVIFFGTIVLSLGIGIFFACRKTKTHASIVDYFLAGRKMSMIPAAMSLVVTYQSSLMIIGNPSEVYSYGMIYAYFVIGGLIAYVFAALAIVPVFHPLRLTSVYKYFNLRYQDNVVRYLVFTFGLLYYTFYMATVTYGTCVALQVIIGLPHWGTIVIYTIVTAIYTSIGGMKAVIWTDVLQLVIMMTGVIAILTKSILEVGGISSTLQQASSRLNMVDFRIDPRIRYQFWNVLCGSFTIFLVGCFQQPGIQRINSIPDLPRARRLFLFAGPLYALFAFIISSEGITIFAYYSHKRCDPLESGRINSPNGIIPVAVSDLFSGMPGLQGLFIASLSSAVLSTLSSALNSLGAVTYDDIIREKFPNLSEDTATRVSKITVFLYGLLAMGFTFLVSVLPGSIISIALSFLSCMDGPTCGVFLVSMMFKRATSKGVTLGALVAVGVIFWLSLGRMSLDTAFTPRLPPAPVDGCYIHENWTVGSFVNTSQSCCDPTTTNTSLPTAVLNETAELSLLQNLYSVSFIAYSFYGCLLTIILSMIFSLLTKCNDPVDSRCLFSFRQHVYLPIFRKDEYKTVANSEYGAEIEVKSRKNRG